MPGCSGPLRFLAAFGRCRNDEVGGRRLAILFSEQRQDGTWTYYGVFNRRGS